MIDEEKLIEEVNSLFIAITGNPKQHTVVNECKKSFINMIDDQPKVGEWIPCSEQLPEFGEPVIICRKNGKVEQGKRDVNGYWSVYGSRIKEVVAWMPLPEPYREE